MSLAIQAKVYVISGSHKPMSLAIQAQVYVISGSHQELRKRASATISVALRYSNMVETNCLNWRRTSRLARADWDGYWTV